MAWGEPYYPLCPIRQDACCMGAMCAWSVREVGPDGVWRFSCAPTATLNGRAVIEERPEGDDPVRRSWR